MIDYTHIIAAALGASVAAPAIGAIVANKFRSITQDQSADLADYKSLVAKLTVEALTASQSRDAFQSRYKMTAEHLEAWMTRAMEAEAKVNKRKAQVATYVAKRKAAAIQPVVTAVPAKVDFTKPIETVPCARNPKPVPCFMTGDRVFIDGKWLNSDGINEGADCWTVANDGSFYSIDGAVRNVVSA